MDKKQKEYFESVNYRMNEEGFDYCFDGYSSWNQIIDDRFHELRRNYLKSMQDLREYIENKVK